MKIKYDHELHMKDAMKDEEIKRCNQKKDEEIRQLNRYMYDDNKNMHVHACLIF